MATTPMPTARLDPVRVLPDHQDKISRGRRRLSAHLDLDLSNTGVLEQFIEERFDAWIEEQISRHDEAQAPAGAGAGAGAGPKRTRKREDKA